MVRTRSEMEGGLRRRCASRSRTHGLFETGGHGEKMSTDTRPSTYLSGSLRWHGTPKEEVPKRLKGVDSGHEKENDDPHVDRWDPPLDE